MMTCSPETTIAEANAFIKRLIDEWLADGSPSPLLFAARYTSQAAAALRMAGQRDDWIRRELLAAFLDGEAASSIVGVAFIETLERRLDEALPPMARPEVCEPSTAMGPDQTGFDAWIEACESSDTAPLLAMVESLSAFARTLQAIGRRDDVIRAEVLELAGTSCETMRALDRAFIIRRVRETLDEVLEGPIDTVN